ncbi:MAG: bifunctional nicotinamidase/pyrazinamidase, partial [Candidatus Heimdallarchaeota archaeon]|nr:bifunctional nicotinamidase/pyrazinamidase [Candidatus Heimdallarchaeota archaeon]MCK5049426.1 bifunctional nicotinamidase/pyrazinamidase [Candidatus Heimdallarchaeota archaeon]
MIDYVQTVTISDKDALLVVDMQNDFLPGGALAVPEGNTFTNKLNLTLNYFIKNNAKVIFSQDWHPLNHNSFASVHEKNPFDPIEGVEGIGPVLWPDHCVQGTEGAEIHPDINNVAHLIIRKGYHQMIDSYSCFLENDKKTETGLDGYLKTLGIKRLFICGLALDYCVFFSAIDAVNKGFEVLIIHDLSKGIARESTDLAI